MKKLVSIALTLIMLTTMFATFAEEKIQAQRAALDALLADAGVELYPGDLSQTYISAFRNGLTNLVLNHRYMDEAQTAEWEAFLPTVMQDIKKLSEGDSEKLINLVSDGINQLETFSAMSKAELKLQIFSTLNYASQLTERQGIALQVLFNELEKGLHNADEAREQEILDTVRRATAEISGLHNVRDDILSLMLFLSEANLVNFSKTHATEAQVSRNHGYLLLIAADEAQNLLSEEDESLLQATLDSFRSEVDALELDFSNLTDADMAALTSAAEAFIAKMPAASEGMPAITANIIVDRLIYFRTLTEEQRASLDSIYPLTLNFFKNLNEETSEQAYACVEALRTALYESDDTAILENIDAIHKLIVNAQIQKNFDTLTGMSDDTLRALGILLIGDCVMWRDGILTDELYNALKDKNLDWSKLSDDEAAEIKAQIESYVVNSSVSDTEKLVESMYQSFLVLSNLNQDETELISYLFLQLSLSLKKDTLTTTQLAELTNILSVMVYELNVDSEEHNITLGDVMALRSDEAAEIWDEKFNGLSQEAQFLLNHELLSDYNHYMLSHYSVSVTDDDASSDAAPALEVNGIETSDEQLAALEKNIFDLVVASLPKDAPAITKYNITAERVCDVLRLSTLSKTEQDLCVSVLDIFNDILADGTFEEMRMVNDYHHNLLHLVSDN